jgi:hypothetical protein
MGWYSSQRLMKGMGIAEPGWEPAPQGYSGGCQGRSAELRPRGAANTVSAGSMMVWS